MKKIIPAILLLVLSFNSFAQKKELYNTGTKTETKAKPAKQLEEIKEVAEKTSQTNKAKYTHIYLIVYKDKNGNHLHEPKKAYRSEGETKEDVIKRVAEQEKGRMYKLNTSNSINKDRPYGLLYSTSKNGKTSYKLGVYTTKEYANKMCDEKERYGATCIEIISLN